MLAEITRCFSARFFLKTHGEERLLLSDLRENAKTIATSLAQFLIHVRLLLTIRGNDPIMSLDDPY